MKRLAVCRIAIAVTVMLCLWIGGLAWSIAATGRQHAAGDASVAIVLGAAVYGDQPSPVFRERIRHAVTLYKKNRVKRLVFTGGFGAGKHHSESAVARDWAIRNGVPADAIIIEERSKTTYQNLIEARKLLQTDQNSRMFIVSDPMHMARALRMGRSLGLNVDGAPTSTSRYKRWRTKTSFLANEIWFHHVWWTAGI